MPQPLLYPLRFEPIFKSNLWGGRRLPAFLNQSPPGNDPIGEAWILSDVDGSLSRIAEGPLAGTTLRELLVQAPERVLGSAPLIHGRFPLLLKFIDAQQELSVQVHPNDEQASQAYPGSSGKTEAWVVLEANPKTSRIYAGFRPGVTAEVFRAALDSQSAPDTLHSFIPRPGDCVFLEAGTVHAIGAEILLFEVQQTSDITYRLYDWDRVDVKTGQPRELHREKGLAVADFRRGPCNAVEPVPGGARGTETLVAGQYFTLLRHTVRESRTVGRPGLCRIVIGISGSGRIEWNENACSLSRGDAVLLPAEVGEAVFHPQGEAVLLECGSIGMAGSVSF